MSEFLPSCQNGTPGLINRSWSRWHHYQVISAAETIILPSLIGIICLTGLVGNILIAFTIIRYLALVQPFCLTHLRTRSNTVRVSLCLWVAPLILMFPVWVYSKLIKFKDGLESCAFALTSPGDVLCYTTSIPRQRVMRLTKMVLALVSVFVVRASPFHMIQLVNLQVSQMTLTFYVSYYISICLSYASSSINPFLYILLSGNFKKCLRQCTNMEVRMAEWMSTSSKTPSSQVFERRVFSQEKCITYV